jgi:hypothetical protein
MREILNRPEPRIEILRKGGHLFAKEELKLQAFLKRQRRSRA